MTPSAPASLALPHDQLRAQFPSLSQRVNGHGAVFLDGPGGTQTPTGVMDAMAAYFSRDNANTGGLFATSRRTDETVAAARREMARFLHAARPEEIVFGQNTTSLFFALAHALRRTWNAGDEVIVTSLDHDANVAPWTQAAADARATVRTWEFRREDCTLALEDLEAMLGERTRLVALTHASNAVGTIPDVAGAIRLVRAKAPHALVTIDAVHYTPHNPVDVQALDCDFLGCSAYKFCGPHLGILYGKYEHLDRLEAYKVRPSSGKPPGKWETGTQSFESIAGLRASPQAHHRWCRAQLGPGTSDDVPAAMRAVREYELSLTGAFLAGAAQVPGLKIYGLTSPAAIGARTPTFGVTLAGWPPGQVAEKLGDEGIFVWNGHFYAVGVVDRLGLSERGGLVRIGFAHYNTLEEVDRVLGALTALAHRRP